MAFFDRFKKKNNQPEPEEPAAQPVPEEPARSFPLRSPRA